MKTCIKRKGWIIKVISVDFDDCGLVLPILSALGASAGNKHRSCRGAEGAEAAADAKTIGKNTRVAAT
jgi:hypothetical protein